MSRKQRLLFFVVVMVASLASLRGSGASQQQPSAGGAGTLVVLNKVDNTAVFIDADSLRVLAGHPTGNGPHEGHTSADGKRVYVADYGTGPRPGNSISVFDAASFQPMKSIDLGPLTRPHGLAEAGGKIYFSAEGARAVGRIDAATERVDWVMGTGQASTHMVLLSPDGRYVFTPNIASDTVTRIDLKDPGPRGMMQISAGRGPEGIGITPDGKELWIGHVGDGSVRVYEVDSGKQSGEPIQVGKTAIRVEFTPDGRLALVSDAAAGQIVVYDRATRKERKRIDVPGQPIGIEILPDGRRAFIAAAQAGEVVELDLEKLAVGRRVKTGQGPDGMAFIRR